MISKTTMAMTFLAFVVGMYAGMLVESKETIAVRVEFNEEKLKWVRAYSQTVKDYAWTMLAAIEKERGWTDALRDAEKKSNELTNKLADAGRRADDAERRLRDEGNSITAALNRMSADALAAGDSVAGRSAAIAGECVIRATRLGGRLKEVARLHDECEIERRTLNAGWPDRRD